MLIMTNVEYFCYSLFIALCGAGVGYGLRGFVG